MGRNFYYFYLCHCLSETENELFKRNLISNNVGDEILKAIAEKEEAIESRRTVARNNVLRLEDVMKKCQINMPENSWKSQFFFNEVKV